MRILRNYYGIKAMVKVGIVQIASSATLEENLEKMRSFAVQAKSEGARIIAFPEMAYLSAKSDRWRGLLPRYAELLTLFGTWARELDVFLMPGTLREPVPGNAEKCFNTLPLIGPDGRLLASYRKIFLFRAILPDRTYDESSYAEPGSQAVTYEVEGATLGFSICFDIRFPELFRSLRARGAQVIFLPAAFTVPTGIAHWSTLLRARAIENQAFVIAPAQTGINGDGAATYGHSSLISPWGEVLLDMGTEEGARVIEIDLEAIGECERKLSAWACRREELFPLPTFHFKT